MVKHYHDKKYNFKEIFDTKTGMYARTGVLDENGNDTNVDPFMRSFPGLIDIGAMGSCAHGRSGLCAKAGVQCYQNGLHAKNPNMKLDDFKRIIDEGEKHGLFQCAIGGAGDPDMHENFEEMMQYAAEHHITPNFTTSGLGMTPEKAAICKKWCGAVAVSQYSRLHSDAPVIVARFLGAGEPARRYESMNDMPAVFSLAGYNKNCKWDGNRFVINGERYGIMGPSLIKYNEDVPMEYFRVYSEQNSQNNYTYKAIDMLMSAGVKTNIHFVLGNNTIDEAILRLEHNGFPKGINAVIFLLHKPVGQGQEANVLQPDDERVKRFFSLIDKGGFPFKVGFDSCTVPGIINNTRNISPESIDSCEGGRYSMYITADMKAIPCSFDNQEMKWAYDISNDTILNAWNSEQFDDFRSHFTNSCPNCPNRTSCYGGCPIRRSTVLCNKPNKNLQ